MNEGTLTIYSASAGSGKTYILTGLYLTSLFRSKYNYRKILAVTFTNKATAEMKNRILDNLHNLATGNKSDYLTGLIASTGKSEEQIREEAKELLFSILHDFSRFSVTTIDAFFQKVIRAFTREAGLHSGFSIELDHSLILSTAVDEVIASAGEDKKLKDWLLEYVVSNLDDEKSWNLKQGIMKLSEELFNEKFKILSYAERKKLEDKDFLLNYIKTIKTLKSSIGKTLLDYGRICSEIFRNYNLKNEMFFQNGRGIPAYINSLAAGIIKNPNSYVRGIRSLPPKWCTGKMSPELVSAINGGLEQALNEAITYYDDNIVNYNSADAVLSDIYALGILSDVLKKVHNITSSENSFLLSDAGEMLNLITKEDQSPFIYEKVGNRYETFMIDEFQDTSIIQWDNFNPLIINSMSEGFDNIVVGDIKQSIYRWRNSDWKILGTMQDKLVDNERFKSKPLKTNWRSSSNIIAFNNSLFSIIPEQIDEEFASGNLQMSFKKLFSEAVQEDPGRKNGGYVKLEFIDDDLENPDEPCGKNNKIIKKWSKKVLDKLPEVIELFEDRGYNAADIGILVRDGREGSEVIKTLIDYTNKCDPELKKRYNYNVVSNDSLILSSSHAVNFIVAVISVMDNSDDLISRAQMLRFYLLSKGDPDSEKASIKKDDLLRGSTDILPYGSEEFIEKLKMLPLFEATESIISFFGLGNYPWNVAYLNTFQDCVISFTSGHNPGIRQFLEWWDSKGSSKSVVLPESQDAARVFTIHKSKGLEFPVVILPFIAWNLDHKNNRQPFLWVSPEISPFNDLRIIPVKYKSGLSETIFSEIYENEKFSSYLDNINLLYVAMTRAKEAIYGFLPETPAKDNAIASVMKKAITRDSRTNSDSDIFLNSYYNPEAKIFEFGEITENKALRSINTDIKSTSYPVTNGVKSLKLKLHAENYFSHNDTGKLDKINYGKLMHGVFENIRSKDDIPSTIKRLVLEGKIQQEESSEIEDRVSGLVNSPPASDWFKPGNNILNEAEILIPSGNTRRPDRVIFMDDKTIIVDFKFGEENNHYFRQIRDYKTLLIQMGYKKVEGYLWYVDINKIVSVD